MVGLVGNILIKKYPDFKEQIPFNELFDWHFWPGFMTIIGTYSKVEYLTVICSMMYCVVPFLPSALHIHMVRVSHETLFCI